MYALLGKNLLYNGNQAYCLLTLTFARVPARVGFIFLWSGAHLFPLAMPKNICTEFFLFGLFLYLSKKSGKPGFLKHVEIQEK